MRGSGILMHLSSLPSPYGIGTMGKTARDFADFLSDAGQSYWQLLPVCPTSYGDSPYQSFSAYAGNPYFLDMDELAAQNLLKKEEYETITWQTRPDQVDYGMLYKERYPLLRRAASRFLQHPDMKYYGFCRENTYWLEDYALFMALKDAHGGTPWYTWEEGLRNREPRKLEEARKQYQDDILFWKIVQYLFFCQWKALRAYVNDKGIFLIGDLPIYVSLDSVDVWAHPELFQLDDDRMPREVSGCPPDGFSADGQLWGNPLFDWNHMAKDNYSWWVNRIDYLCGVYDILRIDHFRGFDSYYSIPYGETNAKNGRWSKGPGMHLFRAVKQALGQKNIIAEDLGYRTDSVRRLLEESGFPGMKVLEFAFDRRDGKCRDYLPHNYIPNCVAYIGTHDNDTVLGWMEAAHPDDVKYAKEYLGLHETDDCPWEMMRALWASAADLTIIQAQDLLGLGSESRMNIPSTVGKNWRWRALPGSFTPELAGRLRRQMELYERLI